MARPTEGMKVEARKGLDWRKEFGRGGTRIGAERARQIVAGENLSDDTIKRMYSFFSRHEVDKQAEGFNAGEEGYPSNGRIAWALWGGDAGYKWSETKVNQMKNEEERQTSFDSQESEKHPLSTNKEEKSMNKEDRHILNVNETDDSVIIEFSKHHEDEQEGEEVEMLDEVSMRHEEEERKVIDMPMKYRTIDLTLNQLEEKKSFILPFSEHHKEHYISALKMFQDSPIFGVGPNMFRYNCSATNYKISTRSCSTHPHNYFIQVLSEIGLIGFIILSISYIYILKTCLKIFMKLKDKFSALNID